jgi:hypothetical protein
MKNLTAALIQFQKNVPTIVKDKSNPFFKSKYSDLASVINGVSETLSRCELAVFHRTRIQDGRNVLVTVLAHSSGEMIESELFIPEQQDPQKLGSLFTYLKRYSYVAILGIASEDEDDDANRASNKHQDQPQSTQQRTQSSSQGDGPKPSAKQLSYIKMLAEKAGVPMPTILSIADADKAIKDLTARTR